MKSYIYYYRLGLLLPFLLYLPYCFGQNIDWIQLEFGNQKNATNTIVSFSGVVKDLNFDLPLIGATIKVVDGDIGTTTNENGTFKLDLQAGQHQLLVSYIGYSDTRINLLIYENAFTILGLTGSAVELEQVTIKEKSQTDNIESVISGVERLDRRNLAIKPKLMGEVDVLRSIQTLSGVTSVGDGASGFNVRGGNADENLILQDGALIFNPTHTLGFFSLFHPDLIRTVNLYKGDQPANFGGRLSSVLEVNLREGDMQKYKANVGVGLISSRLTLEGPIIKDKASIIIGGRGSYLDWILDRVDDIDVRNSSAVFYDFTGKLSYRITDKTKLTVTAFTSADEFRFADQVNFEYQTNTLSGSLNHLVTDKFNIRLNVNIGEYNSSLFDINGNDISRFNNDISYLRGELKGLYQITERQKLSLGVETNSYNVNPGSIEPSSTESNVIAEELDEERAVALSPYLQYDHELTNKLSISAGIRYTTYSFNGPGTIATYEENTPRSITSFTGNQTFEDGETIQSYSAFEPRFSARYILNETSSIKAGANQTFQYLNQISNTASATPVDLWKLSDFYIQPQRSTNYFAGFFKNFADNSVASSIQLFYRSQDRIIEYKDFAVLLLNDNLERELVDGRGRAFGAELNYSMTSNRNFIQFNYTYSKSQRQVEESVLQNSINDGEWFNSNYDKPHSIFVTYSYKTSKNGKIAANFTYSTGRPTTAPVSNFRVDNLLNIPVFSDRNQFRIPDYHRLDFSYSIGPVRNRKDTFSTEFVFSVYNLYGRRNAYSVFFEQRVARSISAFRVATLGTVFPAITLNFSI